MRSLFRLLVFCFLPAGQVCAQDPVINWARGFGNNSTDITRSVAVDAAGNIFTTGNFSGTVDFDPGTGVTSLSSSGSKSAFIQKLDRFGNFLWAKAFGGTSYAEPHSITIDSLGNVLSAGSFLGTVDFNPDPAVTFTLQSMGTSGGAFPDPGENMYVQKLDPDGNFIWAKAFTSVNSGSIGYGQALSIVTDSINNIYIAGSFTGTIDFDPGAGAVLKGASVGKAYITKLDSAGNFVWVNTPGAGGGIYNICYNRGYVYVAGAFTPMVLSSIASAVIQKLDLTGAIDWEKQISGIVTVSPYAIAVDNDYNVITTGSFGGGNVDFDPGAGADSVLFLNSGNGGMFIQKLDSAGHIRWAKNLAVSRSFSITTDMSNNVYTTGYFTGTVNFNPAGSFSLTTTGNAAFLHKLNPSGNFLWAGKFGNSGNGAGQSVSWDNRDGNILMAGYFSGTQDFDPGTGILNLSSVSNTQDNFIVSLNALAALPVKLSFFDAYNEQDHVNLSWQTVAEINTAYFELQRSANGINFETIRIEKAIGNSTATMNYHYTDQKPLADNYYRLRSVDQDGQFEYSAVKRVRILKNSQTLVYPNPVNSFVNIFPAGKLKTIDVFDMNGKIVRQWPLSASNQYNTSGLTRGIYVLKLNYSR